MDGQSLVNIIKDLLHANHPLLLILDDAANSTLSPDFLSTLSFEGDINILTATEQITSPEITQLFFRCQQKNEKKTVIIINQAQRLSLAALTTITHLTRQQMKNASTDMSVYWLLIGAPPLLTTMRSLQNKEIPFIHREKSLINVTSKHSQSHWIKTISVGGLILIGLLLWHHKTHDNYQVIEPPATTPAPEKMIAIAVPAPATATPTITAANAPVVPATPVTPQLMASTTPAPRTIKKIKKKAAPLSPTYILQLMASHDRASLQQFIHRYHLEKNSSIIITHAQGKSWYAIAYGKFSTEKQAEQARRHLPVALENLQPWIKKL